MDLFRQSLRKKDIAHLKSGLYHFALPHNLRKKYEVLNTARAGAVKRAMQFVWKKWARRGRVRRSYRQHAFGHDELKPESGSFSDNWGGVAMTLVDSLDTLYLMGMTREFEEACDWVRAVGGSDSQVEANLAFRVEQDISVFEYTIRLLGGLLSAYDLSGRAGLLRKAVELADLLVVAFDAEENLPAVGAAALCEA